MLKPYVEQAGVFASGDLRKSFFSGGLNKSRTLSGGGSGYRSEARSPITEVGKYSVRGAVLPSKVVKTVIHYKSKGVEKAISQMGYIAQKQAFSVLGFVYKVEYLDVLGNRMIISNTNIR